MSRLLWFAAGFMVALLLTADYRAGRRADRGVIDPAPEFVPMDVMALAHANMLKELEKLNHG